MAYAKKTCNICGWRDIQPRMVKKAKKVQIATSKRGLSGREVLGGLFGSKESVKSIRNWLYAPKKRVYDRKQVVWMCEKCTGAKTDYTIALEAEAKRNKNLELANRSAKRNVGTTKQSTRQFNSETFIESMSRTLDGQKGTFRGLLGSLFKK